MERIHNHFKRESFEDYLTNPAISSHALIALQRSPLHYYEQYHNNYRPTSRSMEFGTLVHMALLEPDRFERVVVLPDFDLRTKKGKADHEAWLKDIPPNTPFFVKDDLERAKRVKDMAQAHPRLPKLLQGGEAEISGYFTELNYNLPCKFRPDYLREDGIIVDIKTTRDASPNAFARSAATYGYHIQAAFYSDAADLLQGPTDDRAFVFVAIENTPPYAIALYHADPDMLRLGRTHYRAAMEKYLLAQSQNRWDGYDPDIKPLALPNWMFYE